MLSSTDLHTLEECDLLAEAGRDRCLLEHGVGQAGGELATLLQTLVQVLHHLLGHRHRRDACLQGIEVNLVVGGQHLHLLHDARDVADNGGNLVAQLEELGRAELAVMGVPSVAALGRHLATANTPVF